jgi:hypothetical protein
VFSFPPRFLDLHRGRAGLVPSDAAASLARRKPRRATQNDALRTRGRVRSADLPVSLGSFGSSGSSGFQDRRVRSDVRAVGSGRSGGFVWLSPLLGFVRGEFGVGWVRSAHWVRPDARTAGFVRMFAPSGPVAPLGSFAPLGWFGFLSCRVRSKRAHVIEPAKELAWRRTASPGPARHRPTRCKARPLIISALPLWACRRGGQTERGRCDHSVADRRKKFQR